MNVEMQGLIAAARAVRLRGYAPYSQFLVGAALETDSGKVFCGANVENRSFGLTSCAERNAVFAAASSGFRRFRRIAIVADMPRPVMPCGACRQVLAEFSDLEVICGNLSGEVEVFRLSVLLPKSFQW